MNKKFTLIFDKEIIKQLKKAAKNSQTKEIISKRLDKLEVLGPICGQLLDSKLFIYELKHKHPPIRIYFKHNLENGEIYVFEYEMKTSPEKQEKTIQKIRSKLKS